MKHIPNLFTLLNLIFGCMAIVFILQNGVVIVAGDGFTEQSYMPEKIWMASLFIGLAGVVDFLDGFVARLFKASSELGKQLDSLADVVSFGVAPGMIMYQLLRLAFANDPGGMDISFLWLSLAFLIPAAAAWRLATFNLDPAQSVSFRGVPTPAVGLLIASFPLLYWSTDEYGIRENILLNKWALIGIIVFLSWLMVSRIPIMSLKFKDFSLSGNMPKMVLLVIALLAIIFLGWISVPVIFLAYLLVSLIFKNKIA